MFDHLVQLVNDGSDKAISEANRTFKELNNNKRCFFAAKGLTKASQ